MVQYGVRYASLRGQRREIQLTPAACTLHFRRTRGPRADFEALNRMPSHAYHVTIDAAQVQHAMAFATLSVSSVMNPVIPATTCVEHARTRSS